MQRVGARSHPVQHAGVQGAVQVVVAEPQCHELGTLEGATIQREGLEDVSHAADLTAIWRRVV